MSTKRFVREMIRKRFKQDSCGALEEEEMRRCCLVGECCEKRKNLTESKGFSSSFIFLESGEIPVGQDKASGSRCL